MIRLRQAWQDIRSSFWFLPGLLVLAAVVLAVALVGLDEYLGKGFFDNWPRLFGASPAGARDILDRSQIELTLRFYRVSPRMPQDFQEKAQPMKCGCQSKLAKKKLTLRLRHTGATVFDCQPRRDPALPAAGLLGV